MAQQWLDPGPIISQLAEELKTCRRGLFRIKRAVSLIKIDRRINHAVGEAGRQRTDAARRYLTELEIPHHQTILYALVTSGVEGLDGFPEMLEESRLALSDFWQTCQTELLKQQILIRLAVESARQRRALRNHKAAGQLPGMRRQRNLRWIQAATAIQILLVQGDVTRKEAARFLDKLSFDFNLIYPKSKSALASRRFYEGLGLLDDRRGSLKTFLDAALLQDVLERQRRSGRSQGDLTPCTPWRVIEKKLSEAKRIALRIKVYFIPTVTDLVEIYPRVKSVFFSPSGVRKDKA
jgi:hypothetical protein